MQSLTMFAGSAVVTFCLSFSMMPSANAEETDFTCIEENVLAKTMVSERYREFDVTLKNDCPGPVNWTMCIEKMDPFTHRVTETLTPSGQIARDKKFRINMQMQKLEDQQNKLSGYEEFYVNVVYDIHEGLAPSCVARRCETEKRPVREQIRANLRQWQKAKDATSQKLSTECPKSGWSDSQREKCMSQIQKEAQPTIAEYEKKDRELKRQLAGIEPETCTIH